MGFFFRPGFNIGPIRLNFSSKGVGASAGNSGARVGVSPGMRPFVGTSAGGAVYRKYLDEGSGSSKKPSKKQNGQPPQPEDEIYHFINTGNTYESPIKQPEVRKVKPPSLPGGFNGKLIAGMILGAGLALVRWQNPFSLSFFIGSATALASGTVASYRTYYNRKAQQQFKTLRAQLTAESPLKGLREQLKQHQLPHEQAQWRDLWLYVECISAYMEGKLALSATDLEDHLSLEAETQKQVKKAVFADVLNQVLEDHLISESEEAELKEVRAVLGLPESAIEQELQTIRIMTQLRKETERSPEPVEVDLNLKQGETCYYVTEGRILKEKIMNHYQEANQVHKEIGYDTEMEGDLYLTDRRLLLVTAGAREYRLNKILDVTLSLEDNTVQLTIEKRKNPVILTAPNAPLLAAKLEQLLEPEVEHE